MYFYVDESGYNDAYVFVAVCVDNPNTPKHIVKRWREWMKHRVKGFSSNEFHERDATDQERKKMLGYISQYSTGIKFWAIVVHGYNGDHERYYVEAVTELLRHCGISEKDVVVAVDRIYELSSKMDRLLRKIKSSLNMPSLDIYSESSEREKGIQVADAIAGAVSKEFLRNDIDSFFEIILYQMKGDLKRIQK